MLLRGNLRDFSLPNIFQLVDMSAKSGALTIRRADVWGKIYFRRGSIYYAFTVPQQLPLGARLMKSGAVTAEQLDDALHEQQREERQGESARIGSILLSAGVIDRATLEQAVREQIQDTAFDFFGWPDGEFEFGLDEEVTDQDILVEMSVENVIMEGCRRIDEWELFVEHVGSMERIPHLTYGDRQADLREIVLTPDEWRAVVHMDGRADITTLLHEAGLDRFHGARVMYSLHSRGLMSVSEPVLQDIGTKLSVAVRGPIDIYNEVFLTTLTEGDIVKQMRVELLDDKEVEFPVYVGKLLLEVPAGPSEILVFTAPASAPEEAWVRVAAETSAWIVLANANDIDSLRSTRLDLRFIRGLGDAPVVVATYLSMAGEEMGGDEVATILGLGAETPILTCHLRDRESVLNVMRRVLALAGS